MAQLVKNPPAMRETWVRPLGWEDPLEKGMATHSSILAWRIPRTEEPDRLQYMGLQKNWTEQLYFLEQELTSTEKGAPLHSKFYYFAMIKHRFLILFRLRRWSLVI